MAGAEHSRVYRDLMRFKPDGLSPNAWAVKAGVSRTVWADMRRHGNPSRRTLEKLLTAADSSLAEFEALRIGASDAPPASAQGTFGEARRRGWIPPSLPPLPLLRSDLAGEWQGPGSGVELMEIRSGELLDLLPRPAGLAGDRESYAVTVVGDSMWPRFRPGRRIAVSPRAPVSIGDDVLVRLRTENEDPGTERVLLKELVKRGGDRIELRQFNPDVTFSVDAAAVAAIQKVAGELM